MKSVGDILQKNLGNRGEPDGDEAAPDTEEDSTRSDTDALFQALKDDDPEAFHSAFAAAVRSCMGEESMPKSEPEPEKKGKGGLAIVLGK